MLLHQKSEGLQGNFGTFHFIICQCGLQRARILCRLFLLLAKNKIADHRCMTKTFFFLQIFIIFSQRTFNSSWRVKKTKTTSLEKKKKEKKQETVAYSVDDIRHENQFARMASGWKKWERSQIQVQTAEVPSHAMRGDHPAGRLYLINSCDQPSSENDCGWTKLC